MKYKTMHSRMGKIPVIMPRYPCSIPGATSPQLVRGIFFAVNPPRHEKTGCDFHVNSQGLVSENPSPPAIIVIRDVFPTTPVGASIPPLSSTRGCVPIPYHPSLYSGYNPGLNFLLGPVKRTRISDSVQPYPYKFTRGDLVLIIHLILFCDAVGRIQMNFIP